MSENHSAEPVKQQCPDKAPHQGHHYTWGGFLHVCAGYTAPVTKVSYVAEYRYVDDSFDWYRDFHEYESIEDLETVFQTLIDKGNARVIERTTTERYL